jgi:hypothetical protein
MAEMITPTAGSKWSDGKGKEFIVIELVDIDNQTWAYYRENSSDLIEPRMYSCFLESFLQRFNSIP